MSDPIMLVDDDNDHRKTLAEALEQEGFVVSQADNGRVALDALQGGARPALILLDMVMPVMDGWRFREAQRADPTLAHIPVVVLSASVKKDPQSPYFMDVADVVPKPVVFDHLLAALRPFFPAR